MEAAWRCTTSPHGAPRTRYVAKITRVMSARHRISGCCRSRWVIGAGLRPGAQSRRYGRLWYLRCQPAATYRTGLSGARPPVQIAPERPRAMFGAMSSPSSFLPGGSSGAGHWGACMQGTKPGSLAGLSRGQHAKLAAIGIGHGHPAGLALADVDAGCPQRDQTAGLVLRITVDGWSEVEM